MVKITGDSFFFVGTGDENMQKTKASLYSEFRVELQMPT